MLDKIIETNPLSEFNRYLYINSANKLDHVFVFKFPKDTGVKVDVIDQFNNPIYILHPLIFKNDVFEEVSINGNLFFKAENYKQCSSILTKLLIMDKYQESFKGARNGTNK